MSVDVSVVMGARGRADTTRKVLQSYTNLSYKNYELLFMDILHSDVSLEDVFNEFKDRLPIRRIPLVENMNSYVQDETTWTPATTWNTGIRKSEGKFVITCSADILLSYSDMIEKFLEQYTQFRISVKTYFITKEMMVHFDSVDWFGNPDSLQTLPGFWDYPVHPSKYTNASITTGGLTTFITGQPKEMWEWMGMFRTELSHLVNDQDMMLRDVACRGGVDTLKDYVAYHLPHPDNDVRPKGQQVTSPGWTYHNEMQARLLEPAPRDSV